MTDAVGQFAQTGVCPDCRTIVGWDREACYCGRRLKKDCPHCSKPYWIWWSDCRGCRGRLPPEGPTKPPPKGTKPFPNPFPQKPFSEIGPCPNPFCYAKNQSWEQKKCKECGHKIERPCTTCKCTIWSWWHKCNDCGWPNKFE